MADPHEDVGGFRGLVHDTGQVSPTASFAALAVSRWIEDQTGWPVRKSGRTARRYRTIQIQAATHTISAPTHYPTTSATPSNAATSTPMRTNLSQVGGLHPAHVTADLGGSGAAMSCARGRS